jgi:hypothetical protein
MRAAVCEQAHDHCIAAAEPVQRFRNERRHVQKRDSDVGKHVGAASGLGLPVRGRRGSSISARTVTDKHQCRPVRRPPASATALQCADNNDFGKTGMQTERRTQGDAGAIVGCRGSRTPQQDLRRISISHQERNDDDHVRSQAGEGILNCWTSRQAACIDLRRGAPASQCTGVHRGCAHAAANAVRTYQ